MKRNTILLLFAVLLASVSLRAQTTDDHFTTSAQTPVSFHCIKHGTLSMQIAGRHIYVDPVTTAAPPATDYTLMPKADVILITHQHPDHLDTLALRQLLTPSTLIVANADSRSLLGAFPVHYLSNNDSLSLFLHCGLLAVPAYNIALAKSKFHPKGRGNGYIITIDDFVIYIAGDTEPIPEMSTFGPIDVAFLPCNLPFTMTPKQLAEAAQTLKPKVLFPYHYGNTDMQKVLDLLSGSSIDVRIRQYQ